MLLLLFILGLIIGSFLNVVILRLPKGKPFIFERSVCMHCEYTLKFYDLVPVASFLLLGGKCRRCKQPISLQYPLVELLTGALFAAAYIKLGWSLKLLEALIFISLAITVTFTDIRYMRIPNKLVLFGCIAALPFIIYSTAYVQAALGFLMGGGILLLLAVLTRGGMGGGDIKFAAMQGLYLGAANMGVTLSLAFVISGVISLLLIAFKIKGRKDAIPFGPFLALAGLVSYFYGSEILVWYFARF